MSRVLGGVEAKGTDNVWHRLTYTHINDKRRQRWWRKCDWLEDRANE